MPNTKSAKKALRQGVKLNAKNVAEKKAIKDLLKKAQKAIDGNKTDDLKNLIVEIQKKLDKAVKSGWIKKNTANRKKSRLAAKIAKK